jgi:hypothetical protein
MAENIYFPLSGAGGGGGSEAAPHITITVDDLKYDYSGTLTAEQLAILAEDNAYINFDIVISSDEKIRFILNKTVVIPSEGTPTNYVFAAAINLGEGETMTFSLLITVEDSSYIGSVFNPEFYLKGVKVNGTELDSPNNIAELNLKTINSQSIVGTGDITVEGGAEVIEKGINLITNKFTTVLTAEEFNKLKNNEAVIKVTTTYFDIIPLVLYGSNPSVINGTAIGSDYDMLVYAIPSPLTDDPAVYIISIQSNTLDSFSIKTIQVNEPVLGNSSTDTYGAISTNPLLGFPSEEADIPQLHMSKSMYIGKITPINDYTGYTWNAGTDNKHLTFVNELAEILNLESDNTNFNTFEAVLKLNENNPNASAIVKKYYSCILHISSNTSNSSEGTFTIYDTATNKITYVILRIYAYPNASDTFVIDYLKAYQDGAEITSTFASKIEAIYLNLL